MKHNLGFTLVELIIVMVIVAILSVVSVPIYKIYIERARETEIYSIVPEIIKAQKFYIIENGRFADNISDLGFQINGKEQTYNGAKGIKTQNYFYSTKHDSNSEFYTTGRITIYRNKGNSMGPGVILQMHYVKNAGGVNFISAASGKSTRTKKGQVISVLSTKYISSSGDQELKNEFYKTCEKFDCKLW